MDERAIWELRSREAWDDPARLRELHIALGEFPGQGSLRFRIAHRLVELRKNSEQANPLAEVFSSLRLPEPDGRWLYQYRLGDAEFDLLQARIRTLGADRIDAGFGPALFALWAAEWFRRNHPGGLRRWEDLETALGVSRPQSQWRETTRRGLQLLGRPIIRTDSFRYFLSTLAREGGFPAAALEAGEQSWATAIMRALVATLLADQNPSEGRALELAHSLRSRMPAVFADDDFVQLCADLAMAVVAVRRSADAEAGAAGIPVAAWLDAKKPGWKNQLPVSLDAKANGLINELLAVRPQRLASGYLDAARYLARIEGQWTEAAVLELNGDVTKAVAHRLAGTTGRLHVYACGELARHLPGELAYIDREEGGQCWMHAVDRRSEMRLVPFRCALDIEVRSAERSEARLRLPGEGDPLRAALIVMTVEREVDGVPVELQVRGTGSGRYRHESIIVQVPSDWDVRSTSPHESVTKWEAGSDRELWRVEGGAVAISERGDVYRILCGQAAETVDRIEITGAKLPGFVRPADPDLLLLRQPVSTQLYSGGRQIDPKGRLFSRAPGTRDWKALNGSLPRGVYEIAWREADIIRDRVSVAVLPETVEISRNGTGRSTTYRLMGWDGCSLTPNPDSPVRLSSSRTEMRASYQTVLSRTFGAVIRWENEEAQHCAVLIDFPCGAGLARWDGRVVHSNERISLSDLDEIAAYSDGRMEVHGRILDGAGKVLPGTEMRWAFDDELPLSVIVDDLRRAMVPAGLHATAQLGMHDGIETYWRVAQYTSGLRKEPGGLVSPVGVVGAKVALCARSLSTYWLETEVEIYGLSERLNHRPVRLPDSLKGPTLAFLREGGRVVTRPVFQMQPGIDDRRTDILGRAMTAPEHEEVLHDFLRSASAASDESRKPVRCLIKLVSSLRGLPPSAFAVLVLLPEYPKALARMLAFASENERADILDLEMALPFAWYTIPGSIWSEVMGELFDETVARLLREGVENEATCYAAQLVTALRSELRERHPILSEAIFPQNRDLDLASVIQRFLNQNVDRVAKRNGSIFRSELGDRLPAMLLDLPAHCLEVMEAPIAGALAARGAWQPSSEHIARLKLVARMFPSFFQDAFATVLALPAKVEDGLVVT